MMLTFTFAANARGGSIAPSVIGPATGQARLCHAWFDSVEISV
ncbi:hypothetical protein [Rhodopila globiformis]|nr:hypothetical protein [Rhodopila globiformis]